MTHYNKHYTTPPNSLTMKYTVTIPAPNAKATQKLSINRIDPEINCLAIISLIEFVIVIPGTRGTTAPIIASLNECPFNKANPMYPATPPTKVLIYSEINGAFK